MSLPMAQGWTRWSIKVLSNPNQPEVLWFYEIIIYLQVFKACNLYLPTETFLKLAEKKRHLLSEIQRQISTGGPSKLYYRMLWVRSLSYFNSHYVVHMYCLWNASTNTFCHLISDTHMTVGVYFFPWVGHCSQLVWLLERSILLIDFRKMHYFIYYFFQALNPKDMNETDRKMNSIHYQKIALW